MTTTTLNLKCRTCGAHPNGPDGEARDTFRDRHVDETGESWFCAEHHSGKGIHPASRRSFLRQRAVQERGDWGTGRESVGTVGSQP